jgi:hypothetical protein
MPSFDLPGQQSVEQISPHPKVDDSEPCGDVFSPLNGKL